MALLIACGKGDRKNMTAADTAGRDLQLAPVDTSASLSDVAPPADSARAPATVPETVVVYRDGPKPAPKPAAAKARPATAVPGSTEAAAPAAAPRLLLADGVKIETTNVDSISSAFDSAGHKVKVRVSSAVSDAAGHVVIPAGSIVTLNIEAIKWSENKNDKGTLRMSTQNVSIDGAKYPLVGTVSTPAFTYKHRGSSLGDAAKVAGGAGAGAVVGGLIGKGTGALIGGVVGGAVGAQRMSQTKDNDIIVAPGTPITIMLNEPFTR
jgi:hypothetical protein